MHLDSFQFPRFCEAIRNPPSARIEGTHVPTKIPLSLSSIVLSFAKNNQTLSTRLAIAASRIVIRRMSVGFIVSAYHDDTHYAWILV